MTSYLLDANPILRFLLNDIPAQATQTETLLQQAGRLEVSVTIPTIVLTEIVFTLTKTYRWPKDQVVNALLTLATSPSLDIQNRPLIIEALNIFKNHPLGFTDSLLLAESKDTGKIIFTFDKKLSHLSP